MSRKAKRSNSDQKRHADRRQKEKDDALVTDTVAQLGCSAATARDMLGQCSYRRDEIDLDLTFAGLARHVWTGRPGRGEQLVPLIDEIIAEQQRHAKVMDNIGERLRPIANAEHEHLPPHTVDPDHVRRALLPPPDDRPSRADGQIPTESDGR